MKNLIVTFLLISITSISLSAQNELILDNNSNDPMHYKTFAEAIEAATAGSTILVHGSGTSYGDITIDKAVNIMGPGFYIGENPGTENMSTATAKFGAVNVTIDGGGAILSGLVIEGICTIKGNNTFIQRNQIKAVRIDNANDVVIGQNSIYSYIQGCAGFVIEIGGLHVKGACDGIYIHNNYINGQDCSNSDEAYSIESNSSSVLILKNNVIQFGGVFYNSMLENNIIIAGNTPSVTDNNNNTYHNNIFLGDKPGLIGVNNNKPNAGTLDDIFTREGKTLTRFTIRDDSVAKGAGKDGTDAGIFGGLEPFVPSGIPGIPTVYSIEMPTNVNDNKLTIKVKARTNN